MLKKSLFAGVLVLATIAIPALLPDSADAQVFVRGRRYVGTPYYYSGYGNYYPGYSNYYSQPYTYYNGYYGTWAPRYSSGYYAPRYRYWR